VTTYRLSDLVEAGAPGRRSVRLGDLYPPPECDAHGAVLRVPAVATRLSSREVARLLAPYLSSRIGEQRRAVLPLAAYLLLFQLLILRAPVDGFWTVAGGLLAVIVGLMLFMEGLRLGLMPFGTVLGATLPRRAPRLLVLVVTLLLGIGVTFAEPAIGALQTAGRNVSVHRAPYLYALLNDWAGELVLVVGASVGLAAVVGTLRFLHGWSLRPLIYASVVPVLGLSVVVATHPELATALGLAWDTGAVTTGPVTVPLVLSLGIGIAAAAGKGDSGLAGFGIVTLASLFPIAGVLLLLCYVGATVSPAEIVAGSLASTSPDVVPWYARTPVLELLLGVRAILPLVAFLLLVLRVLLAERLRNAGEIALGIALAVVGMCFFNVGLTYGLSALGGGVGALVPTTFLALEHVPGSPLYGYWTGLLIAIAFAWVLGYGATVAEPALNALGATAERLTQGVFRSRTLVTAVSLGVAFGIAAGVVRLMFDLPLLTLIVPAYLVALLLTWWSSEEFVNVAWDSAGVTTGPITVPLVLAMGLGFGDATDAVEGFGILSLASVGPIITVLASGLLAKRRARLQVEAAERDTWTPTPAETGR
jgi:hypothetical protein